MESNVYSTPLLILAMPVWVALFKWLFVCVVKVNNLIRVQYVIVLNRSIHFLENLPQKEEKRNEKRQFGWWLEKTSHNTLFLYTQSISLLMNLQINFLKQFKSFNFLAVAEIQVATSIVLNHFVSPVNKDWYGSQKIKFEERDRNKYSTVFLYNKTKSDFLSPPPALSSSPLQ